MENCDNENFDEEELTSPYQSKSQLQSRKRKRIRSNKNNYSLIKSRKSHCSTYTMYKKRISRQEKAIEMEREKSRNSDGKSWNSHNNSSTAVT
jgi:hypothetical protein